MKNKLRKRKFPKTCKECGEIVLAKLCKSCGEPVKDTEKPPEDGLMDAIFYGYDVGKDDEEICVVKMIKKGNKFFIEEYLNWKPKSSKSEEWVEIIDIKDMPGYNPEVKNEIDSVSKGFVTWTERNKATCHKHGAMLCVSPDRKIWRCPECHVGCYVPNPPDGEAREPVSSKKNLISPLAEQGMGIPDDKEDGMYRGAGPEEGEEEGKEQMIEIYTSTESLFYHIDKICLKEPSPRYVTKKDFITNIRQKLFCEKCCGKKYWEAEPLLGKQTDKVSK